MNMIRWPLIVFRGDLFRCHYIGGKRILINLTLPWKHYVMDRIRQGFR